jgi:membrane protease YdiL (CAAX protease family)
METTTTPRPQLIPTLPADSRAWMRRDLAYRLLPFGALVAGVWLRGGRPSWLGIGPGRLPVQLGFGIAGGTALFAAAAGVQLLTMRVRGALRVPASGADLALQAGYYALNAPIEEALFRGLLQGGLGAALSPWVGLGVGTTSYALYHRLGGWPWTDVLATALAGVPLGLAFRLLPGPPSLLGVSLAHVGATCGYIGPGPWLLHRLGLF